MYLITKAQTAPPRSGSAPPSSRAARAAAPPASTKQSPHAALAEAAKRQRKHDPADLMASRHQGAVPAQAKSAAVPTKLPPAPMLTRYPDHMDTFAQRDLLVQFNKYLRVADAVAAVRGFTRAEADDVARAQRERHFLAQHTGLWVPSPE